MPLLNLTADELLSTTRSVRKRLDLTRPVEADVIRECLQLAMQAPTGGNRQQWHWIVVTDAAKRQAIGDCYRRGWDDYMQLPINQPGMVEKMRERDPARAETQVRVKDSSEYLAAHIHEVPVLVIPCLFGRPESLGAESQAGFWGSILPAAWSFMLALRSRGLGSAWTTLHLAYERDAAAALGIPFERITQCALFPVAYTTGTDFKPAPRDPLDKLVHWDTW